MGIEAILATVAFGGLFAVLVVLPSRLRRSRQIVVPARSEYPRRGSDQIKW
jgi:hypothetical protein